MSFLGFDCDTEVHAFIIIVSPAALAIQGAKPKVHCSVLWHPLLSQDPPRILDPFATIPIPLESSACRFCCSWNIRESSPQNINQLLYIVGT